MHGADDVTRTATYQEALARTTLRGRRSELDYPAVTNPMNQVNVKRLDLASFQRIAELQDSGQFEEVIRESKILVGETTDPNEQASLLFDGIVACQILNRLGEARQMLDKLKRLDISDVEGRLNAESCEPCILIQENKLKEGEALFAAMLQRNSEALMQPDLRYLYEDIQRRRAFASVELSRFNEALPILRDAISFSFEDPDYEQTIQFYLAECLDETGDSESAKRELIRVIEFGIKNDFEEHARYRLARLYFQGGGFAQARQQLETILKDHPNGDFAVSRRNLYEMLSRTYRQLGDMVNAEHYKDLAKGS
jgi:tetratricopeptide (TPR) repeat protein